MEVHEPVARRRTGRPLSFDKDAVLQRAMLTFWRYGYETTSISDLTAAMNISAPSLYAAFGDKKQLFLAAVQRYAGERDAMARTIDVAATSYEAAHGMLRAAAIAFTGESTPPGCLLASATASGSAGSADVRQEVASIRGGIEALLKVRIERDIADKVLPAQTQAGALSGLVIALIQGLSVLARDGATRASLLATVEAAMKAWPTGS